MKTEKEVAHTKESTEKFHECDRCGRRCDNVDDGERHTVEQDPKIEIIEGRNYGQDVGRRIRPGETERVTRFERRRGEMKYSNKVSADLCSSCVDDLLTDFDPEADAIDKELENAA